MHLIKGDESMARSPLTARIALGVAGAAAAAVVGAGVGSADPAGLPAQRGIVDAPLPLDPPPAPAPGAPLPTGDEVAGMLTRLTDAGITYKEKGDLVENGITQEEGHGLDHELRKAYRDGELPFTFDVGPVLPAGPNQATTTVTISGPKKAPQPTPVMLVDQGSWVLSHDSATALFGMLAQH